MKKLVLVVAMFMFVCGGSFLAKAQSNSEKAVKAPTEVKAIVVVNDTVVTDTVAKDSTTAEPAKE
ncbi:hypothetical protein [Bacteroides sp.]|uniref:hypothetical protein n=1 Tax=Bacteroides sp. TaxID=29523 RepID=UPI0026361465|nr:hypothetical protein [Bacteroides sp.]MDD3039315.1 hypothetical protein [Bacteroides sp.]